MRSVFQARRVIPTLEVGLLLALACSFAAALDSDRTIAQYAHTAWGPKDGAPGVIRVLAQSTDGYLWLGTPNGLYRFDGLTFEHYQPQSGGPIPTVNITSLLALPDGDLWIGFGSGGIIRLKDGRAIIYTSRDGVPRGAVRSFAQDREGAIWAGTVSGLARLEGNRWKEIGKDWNFPARSANAVFLDRQGTLWVSTEDTLVYLPSGTRRFRPTGVKVGQVPQIAQAGSGKLWMAETSRSVRPVPLSDRRQSVQKIEIQVGSGGILFDNDGGLWIATLGDGLRRSPAPQLLRGRVKEFGSEADSFTTRDGLSDDVVFSVLQDREGNIWVGTREGLDRFRKTNLVPVALPFKDHQWTWVAGDHGDIWTEHQDVVTRVRGVHAQANQLSPRPGMIRTQISSAKAPSLFAYGAPSRAIWWIDALAIYLYQAGSYTRIELPASFSRPYLDASIAATEDGSGTLWLGGTREGLLYREKGGWKRLEVASEFAKLSPQAAFTDWMGRPWFGYDEGTIVILNHKNIDKAFLPSDSLVGGVRAISGRGRHTWVAGELGLAFFDGKRFQRIVPADAESFGSVTGVVETFDGSLWLAETRGAIRIPGSEIQQALDHPSHRVTYRIFDSFDGLQGTIGGVSPYLTEIQGSDGRLWFAATRGIVWVDPTNIVPNPPPPPVLIRSVKTNGRQLDSLANLALPPRTTDLRISYTGLTLSVPERVHFRYRLEGVDRDWQDAGTRREAFYTRLGPGQYHFQVIACNNDGVCNDKGAHLDFEIAPAWYQTNWFRSACAGVFLTLLWGLYQLRLQQLRKQFNVRLEARINERARIAQDLHDTFFQGIQGLLLRFHTAMSQLPKDEPARRIFEETLKQSDQVMLEGRELVLDLRATVSEQNDLPTALADFAEGMRNGGSCEFKLVVNGRIGPLHPVVFEEVVKIGKEALTNAFRHSGAHSIETELNYERDELRLRIRDDGRGIDASVLQQGHRQGHFGLPGMRERAKKLRAHLDVWSGIRTGTEVELRIAAGVAYASPQSGSWLWKLRRLWPGAKGEDGPEENTTAFH